MKLPFVSRRSARAEADAIRADRERIRKERDQFRDNARACARQLERFAAELSALKEEVALNIVASQHPFSTDSSAHAAATALREACEARGIDLRVEFARLEGSQL